MDDTTRNTKMKDMNDMDDETNGTTTIMQTNSDCSESDNRIRSPQQYIRLGICAMDKKARSKPMSEILSRLDDNLFEIIFFGDEMLLNDPVTSWPIVDVIIAFYSSGYPLSKAEEYVKLHKPYVLNDLEMQRTLMDRRKVYDLLEDSGIDVPRHVYMNRDGYVSHGSGAGVEGNTTGLIEHDDDIEINGVTMNKPFVEKPVDAEDHNIAIYYPTSHGGGCKKLFRKIGDRSSEFYPDINTVRRSGSYIYEEFVETQGTDVKMYTVGPDYGHAEARKSPAVDGKVERDSTGKEMRFPVILTLREKEIARRIVLVFKQHVCGFDLLRVQDGISYVCDVNGFSFVKNSRKYYDDCACILSEHMIALVKPKSFRSFSTINPLMITKRDSFIEENMKKKNYNEYMDGSTSSIVSSPRTAKAMKKNALRKVKRLLNNATGASSADDNDAGHSTAEAEDTTIGNSNGTDDLQNSAHSFLQQPVRDIPNALAQQPASLNQSPCGSVGANEEIITQQSEFVLSNNNTIPLRASDMTSVSLDYMNHSLLTQTQQEEQKPNTHQEELRCVIAIIRHGDRTPKQKLKLITNDEHVIEYYHSHSKNYRKDLKIKNKQSMEQMLRTIKQIIKSHEIKVTNKDKVIDDEEYQIFITKIYHMRDVLVRWKINGLNRKLQIKPLKWEESEDGAKSKNNKCIQVHLILKWGGNLTKLGEKQAITLGQRMRHDLYPDAPAGGLLRLHSTFRHDLKIKTSDEGRVMKTAAAFSKGLLELEGEITPILVSLVHKERDQNMLDPSGNKEVKSELEKCKNVIAKNLQLDIEVNTLSNEQREELVGPLSTATSIHEALRNVHNPRKTLFQIHGIIGELIAQLEDMLGGTTTDDDEAEGTATAIPEQETLSGIKLYKGETLLELTERWRFLYRKMYNKDKDTFDLSRIPDVHDNVRFDMLHNPHLGLSSTLENLYTLAKKTADCVVPQEYGTTLEEKRSIGSKMCRALMDKIKDDLIIARTDNQVDMRYMINMDYSADLSINTLGRRIRTRLYFTSESHLHTLLNVLRIAATTDDNDNTTPLSKKGKEIISNTSELCYLTQIILRLFEDPKKDINDPKRFRVEIFFSPGATATPLHMAEMDREILDRNRFDTSTLECISKDNLTCHEMEEYFDDAMKQGRCENEESDEDVAVKSEHLVVEKKKDTILNNKQDSKKQPCDTNNSKQQPQGSIKKSTSIAECLDELAGGIRNTFSSKSNTANDNTVATPTNNESSINATPTLTIPSSSATEQQNKVPIEESFIVEEKVQQLATNISYQLLRRTIASMTMVLGVGCIVVASHFNFSNSGSVSTKSEF